MRRQALITVCVGLLALTAGGCMNLKKAPDARSASKVPVLEAWAKVTAENGAAVRDDWVGTFNDPVLDGLVREALDNNRDLQVAAGRRDQAYALAERAGADLWPTLDLNAGTFGSAGNQRNSSFLLGVANWELDLWGRIRYLTRAATAEAYAAEADLEFARQSIAALVADTYYLAIANQMRLANARTQLTIQEDVDRRFQAQRDVGQVGKLESELSRSDLARYRADVQDRLASFEQSLRALEVLLGRYPSADIDTVAVLPAVVGTVPAGVPSELLERRPDIIAAEQLVASAFYQTESARADLLPRVALTAQGGMSSAQLNNLLDSSSAGLLAGAQLTQPLFDAGARFANIRAFRAVQEQALGRYAGTALRAFREVQDALANEIYFRERAAQLRVSSASMDEALPAASNRFRAGDISLLNFKQVQDQAYSTTDAYIAAQLAQIQQRIDLHRALGGSIVARPATRPTIGPATQPTGD